MTDSTARLTLRGIEVFLAVVQEGSISLGARKLGASPSSVSQQITNLETALDTRLIDRAARPLRLTPPGNIFLRRAETITSEAALAHSEIASGDLSGLASFRLGMIEDFDANVTPRLLADLSAEFRACHFVLETGASYHLAAMLEARQLDMFVAADFDVADHWMDVYPLLSEPFIVVTPPDIIDTGKDVLAQLLKLPLIRYSARQMMGRQIEAHLGKTGLNIPHRFELDSYHAIMAMVSDGAGWTITTPLGYSYARRFMQKVDVMPLPFAPLERRISLLARRDAMGGFPEEIAKKLRPLLREMIVNPCVSDLPWLDPSLCVL